jgi:hypothetical protein
MQRLLLNAGRVGTILGVGAVVVPNFIFDGGSVIATRRPFLFFPRTRPRSAQNFLSARARCESPTQ